MASIIIVGGGYGGSLLARRLDPHCDVTLIEPRDAFVHNVAAMRAVTAPELVDRIVLPYDRLLKRGRVLRDRVTGLGQSHVALASGRVQQGDAIVVATGSRYAAPFKPQTDRCDDFRAAVLGANQAIRQARHVAIVGAGAVGVELAGEIAASMPGKTVVTLISEGQSLFPDFTAGLGRRLEQDLHALGVRLIKGMRVADLKSTDHPVEGPLTLSDGKTIDADLVIPAIGSRFDNTLLRTVPQATFDSVGRAIVDFLAPPSGLREHFRSGRCRCKRRQSHHRCRHAPMRLAGKAPACSDWRRQVGEAAALSSLQGPTDPGPGRAVARCQRAAVRHKGTGRRRMVHVSR